MPAEAFEKLWQSWVKGPLLTLPKMRSLDSRAPSSIEFAAAAKSLQSCPTLCNPMDSSPAGSPVHGILQARTLEWVAISFSAIQFNTVN